MSEVSNNIPKQLLSVTKRATQAITGERERESREVLSEILYVLFRLQEIFVKVICFFVSRSFHVREFLLLSTKNRYLFVKFYPKSIVFSFWNFKKKLLKSRVLLALLGSLRNHDGNENGNVTEQKNNWAERCLCTCVTVLCTFLCRSLQENNVKWPNFALFREREPRQLIF